MKLQLKANAQLFKITWQGKDGLVSTFCLARDADDARTTFRAEYAYELRNKIVKESIGIEKLKPNDKKACWHWFEFAFIKNRSIILSTNLIK